MAITLYNRLIVVPLVDWTLYKRTVFIFPKAQLLGAAAVHILEAR